jgi:hypothetical protein
LPHSSLRGQIRTQTNGLGGETTHDKLNQVAIAIKKLQTIKSQERIRKITTLNHLDFVHTAEKTIATTLTKSTFPECYKAVTHGSEGLLRSD